MKVSFIICYSSTKPMTIFDPSSWKKRNSELEEKILLSTNNLIKQILTIPIDKEILLMDNSGDFKTLTVLESTSVSLQKSDIIQET